MDRYDGTVTIAPPTRNFNLVDAAIAGSQEDFAATTMGARPKLIAAVTAMFPAYNFSGLTPTSADRSLNVIAPLKACLPTNYVSFEAVPTDQLAVRSGHQTSMSRVCKKGRNRLKGVS
jgi:hypothetical protein